MDSEARDGQRNQRQSRYANERFKAAMNESSGPDGQLIPFLCECADGDCRGSIDITAWRYEDIHFDRQKFVILPGHDRVAGEEIVEANSYYEIVRKAA